MRFHPALPHGPLTEVFPNVFFVTGTSRPTFMQRTWQFSRNMVVIRQPEGLVLLNTVRLGEPGLETLRALGEVRHVVRLGAFHGLDDAFYVERFGATLWGLPGMQHEAGLAGTARDLRRDGTPITDATLFCFESTKVPEAIALLPRHGGIAISCDALQNWAAPDDFFDAESAEKMRELGFIRPANIGPGWRAAAEPAASDFERLAALNFENLLPAHGTPMLGGARAAFEETLRAIP